MNKRKSIFLLSIALIIALSACNLPGGSQSDPAADLALTITAQALLLQPGSDSGQPNQQQPDVTDLSATPAFTPTPNLTVTPSIPQVTVSVNTNCRTGPGTIYDLIDALLVTQTAEVVGKNTANDYWIIKRLNGSGTCWLWGKYATVSGNTANLPEYPVPPTPTPSPTPTFTPTPTLAAPAPVANVSMNMVCPSPNHAGTLSWEDKSNNEDGFNIYANGNLLASIPANSTSYNVVAVPGGPFPPAIASLFEVEAFNAAGKAAKKSVSMGCP